MCVMSYVDKYVPAVLGIVCVCWVLKGIFSAIGGSVPERKNSVNSSSTTENSNNGSGGN